MENIFRVQLLVLLVLCLSSNDCIAQSTDDLKRAAEYMQRAINALK